MDLSAAPRALTVTATYIIAVELHAALKRARRGSTPGEDGLPYELYRAFASAFVPTLLHVFNSGFSMALGQLRLDPTIPDAQLFPQRKCGSTVTSPAPFLSTPTSLKAAI